MKVAFFALLLLMVSAGCGTGGLREFPVLGSVTAVKIRFGSHPLLQITDARTVFQIVAFVDSHGTGWEKRWYGIQVPVATAEFYSGSDFKGSFGIGENFFESQRNGGFFSKSAAPSEVRRFLDLLEPVGADVERGRILDGDFKPMRSVELVPLQVKAAFAGLTKESGFEMADPGQDFQLTDVIVQGKAPLAENDSLPEYLTRRASCTMKGVAEDTRITWLSSLQIRPERCSFGVVHYPSLRQRSRNSDS